MQFRLIFPLWIFICSFAPSTCTQKSMVHVHAHCTILVKHFFYTVLKPVGRGHAVPVTVSNICTHAPTSSPAAPFPSLFCFSLTIPISHRRSYSTFCTRNCSPCRPCDVELCGNAVVATVFQREAQVVGIKDTPRQAGKSKTEDVRPHSHSLYFETAVHICLNQKEQEKDRIQGRTGFAMIFMHDYMPWRKMHGATCPQNKSEYLRTPK